MEEERKAYEEKLEAQLREWAAQIALLRDRADRADAGAKSEHLKTVEALRQEHDTATTQLHALKTAGDEEWEDLKSGAEGTWEGFTTALERAIARLP